MSANDGHVTQNTKRLGWEWTDGWLSGGNQPDTGGRMRTNPTRGAYRNRIAAIAKGLKSPLFFGDFFSRSLG